MTRGKFSRSTLAAHGQTAIVTVNDNDNEISVQAFPAESTALDAILPLLRSGRLAEAVSMLESLNRSAPNNVNLLYNLGVAYSELGQQEEAIIRLKKAVQLDPAHVHAWVGIGNAYYCLGKREQALDAFEKAVVVNPDDGYSRWSLGGILTALKQPIEAIEHLRKAFELMPDDVKVILDLAFALEDASYDGGPLCRLLLLHGPRFRSSVQASGSAQARWTALCRKRSPRHTRSSTA